VVPGRSPSRNRAPNTWWILVRLSHDPLLPQADLTRDPGDHVGFSAADRGHDCVREAERRGPVQPAPLSIRAATAVASRSASYKGTVLIDDLIQDR
jgi:hypothetical protein